MHKITVFSAIFLLYILQNLYAFTVFKTQHFSEGTLKIIVTDKKQKKHSVIFTDGKITDGSADNIAYTALYDESLILRVVSKYTGVYKAADFLFDQNGNIVTITEFTEGMKHKVVEFYPNGQIKNITDNTGHSIISEHFQYNQSGDILKKELKKNNVTQRIWGYAYYQNKLTEIRIYDKNKKMLSYKQFSWEIPDNTIGQLTKEKLILKRVSHFTSTHKLLAEELHYLNVKGQLLFASRKTPFAQQFAYDPDGVLSKKMLLNTLSDKTIQSSVYYYFSADEAIEHRLGDRGNSLIRAITHSIMEPGEEKIKSSILFYNIEKQKIETADITWAVQGWNITKKFVGNYYNSFQFNSKKKLIRKTIYNENSDIVGEYHYVYDPHGNLIEESLLGRNERLIKRITYFYSAPVPLESDTDISFYINNYLTTGFHFTGLALFNAMEVAEKNLQENRKSAFWEEQKKSLLRSLKHVGRSTLNKIIYYNHKNQIVRYVRIKQARKSKKNTFDFEFYSRPVNFFYSRRKDTKYYLDSLGGMYGYKRVNNSVEDTSGRAYEFIYFADDNINPEKTPTREHLWKKYTFTVNKNYSEILNAQRTYFDLTRKIAEKAHIHKSGIVIHKVPDKDDAFLEAYIDKLDTGNE
jgi:hypothetical protein